MQFITNDIKSYSNNTSNIYTIGNVTHTVSSNLIFDKPIPMTCKKYLEDLYKCLKYVVNFLEKHKISYCLESGSLLGCIRHNGFIPWDNDIDIMIFNTGYFKLLTLIYEFNNNNLDISLQHSIPGYKIYYKNKTQGELFVYDYDKIQKLYRQSFPYINDKPTFKTGDIYYTYKKFSGHCLFPFKRMLFEDIYINVPNNYNLVLNIIYNNSNLLECKYSGAKNSQYESVNKKHYVLLGYIDKLLLSNKKNTAAYDILHNTINAFAKKI